MCRKKVVIGVMVRWSF